MQKDYGFFLLLISCLIVLSLTWSDYKGYSSMVSDWSDIECDWATNRPVAEYYQKKPVGSYRTIHTEAFVKEIIEKKKLDIGIDYYALMGVCANMVPVAILQKIAPELIEGRVYVFRVVYADSLFYWEPRR